MPRPLKTREELHEQIHARWTAEPADEHGTPGLWRHGDGEPQLRYIARPGGSDDRRVPADAYRLLRRVHAPTDEDVELVARAIYASRNPGHDLSRATGITRPGYTQAARAVLAALAEQTGDE